MLEKQVFIRKDIPGDGQYPSCCHIVSDQAYSLARLATSGNAMASELGWLVPPCPGDVDSLIMLEPGESWESDFPLDVTGVCWNLLFAGTYSQIKFEASHLLHFG